MPTGRSDPCPKVLRLHPPTLWSNRGIVTDTVLESATGSAVLPAGSCAFIPIWAVHRSPLNWPDRPNEFLPERFLPGVNGKAGHHPFAFIPFGGGRRVCPGQQLALFEIKVALARMASRLSFSPSKDAQKPVIHAHGMVQQCLNNVIAVAKRG